MNVLIDWDNGLPERPHQNIDRVQLLDGKPLPSLLPEKGVLYVNPSKVRTIRVVDDREQIGERLMGLLAGRDDREPRELSADYLIRILRERDEARQPVAQ